MEQFLKARPAHKAQLAANWQQAFGDDEAYTDFVFDRFAGLAHTYIAEENGAVIGSVCAVPVSLAGHDGVYIYGVNTREDKRGQGVMDGLLRFVHQQEKMDGKAFALLVPAGKKLFDYYEKFGYKTLFYQHIVQRSVRNNLWAQADFDTITAPRLTQLRERFLGTDFVRFAPAAHAAMMQDLYTGGATTVETEGGYGVFFQTSDTKMEFKELAAADQLAANRLLEAARQKTGCEQAIVRLARSSEVYLGEGGQDAPYGQLCWLCEPFRLSEPYMGLMCD